MKTPLIYLIAGEPSGDLLGARLMKALKAKTNGQVRFCGIGGPHMCEEGLESLFDMSELTVMGLAEVLPHIPKILRRIKQTAQDVESQKPDCLITIDAPGFTFRVAKKLKGKNIPLIHYVAPTVWAWKPGRAKKIAQFLDHLMVILPFEPPYFEKEGLKTTFVGHSVIESGIDDISAAAFKERHGIPADVPLLCMLPGSRQTETSQLLPIFKDAVTSLKAKYPNLRIVLPTVSTVSQYVKEMTMEWGIPILIVEGDDEKFGAFKAADVALAASGTVSLELALAKTPSVITYRMKKMTHFLAKRLVKVKYASIVNLLHDRYVIPELIQDDCTPENIVTEVSKILDDAKHRHTQDAEIETAMKKLGLGDGQKPSERAADCVLSLLQKDVS
ncbi:Lipid-A-disaccharide synthase [Candidatus Terasakiella magnetica]|uniref:Lipid-A-disaccharide synthase n=1 Tax=Candidatus Terasakiella magnetica TaxID=1867952 RepID=A0A1C3RCS5_9PROT|nr:lipid-A-disaccharide synthase [Candidatus Terasakiella magnetica]SCA55034.1 Lipid-A-disaccharide synthase [Candidatus Terasakiella magnetica]